MKSTVLIYVNRFRHDRHERLVLGFVLLILAMFVTMTVYWQLRYTGITMTNETYCGIEEHIHTDECYESVLVCGYEDGEIEIAEGTHVHTDECYLSESVLVCGLEENEEHTHTAECYEVQQILICGYEEATVHVHTDECYELQLTCGLEEHTHSIECMIDESADLEDATVWEATLPELTGELRTDVVSIAQSQLGYTESTANYTIADDESHNGYTRYGAWYGNEYGSWDTMFAAFCLHYAGIDETEFPVNSGAFAWAVQLGELGRYVDAADYIPTMGDIVFFDSDGDERVDRVGIVTAVDESAGMVTVIEGDYTAGDVDTVCEHIYPLSNSTIIAYGVLPEQEEEATADEEITSDETTDDEVIIDEESTDESTDKSGDEAADNMDEDTVIDGETDSETEAETEETEELEEGVWVITDETAEDEEAAEETEDVTVFTASDSDVNVTVIAPNGALPDNAVLSVTLVDEESEEYQAAAEAVGYDNTSTTEETTETADENAIATISDDESADETETTEESGTSLAVLDISFTVDGVEVEPTEAVTVIIDASSLMTDDADASTLEVQHLEETEEGITPVLVADATDDTEGTVYADAAVAEFTVEGFSTFTITWNTHNKNGTRYGAEITVNVYTLDGTTSSSATGDTFSDSFSTNTNNNNSTLTISIDALVAAISGVDDDYEFSYATIEYSGTTYGSESDSITSVSIAYSKSGGGMMGGPEQYTYTPTYYTASNTSGTTLSTTSTQTEKYTFSDLVVINLYYAKTTLTDGLYIIDNIITDGEYAAQWVVGGEVVTDYTGYTITWYKSGYTLSDDLSTCTNNKEYTAVTDTEALGSDPSTVNVAINQGGLCYYYVEITDSSGTVIATSDVVHVEYAAELMNCSFEYNESTSTGVPFWATTASDGEIEIGSYAGAASNYGTQNIYAGGSRDVAGDYFAELNANVASSLYQDVLTIGGEALNWAFYHRARTADGGSWQGTNITDEMYVVIMSTEDAEMLLDGVDQDDQQSVLTAMITSILNGASYGSGSYTLVSGNSAGETVKATIWTVSSTNSYQTGEWNYNSGSYTVPEGQYVTRFFFVSKSSGYSSTNYTVGNLIDYATFSQNINYTIEYWVGDSSSGYTLMKTETSSAYPLTLAYAQYLDDFSAYGLVGSITGTASGGSNPSPFDSITTTGLRVTSGTMYLSLYLSEPPIVTIVKKIDGLDATELSSLGDYTVTFTIAPTDSSSSAATETITVSVGSTGVGSSYTTTLVSGVEYTISEVVAANSFLDGYYELSGVTVTGANTGNGIGSTYTFTPDKDTSLTITFTNTYTEDQTYSGGPEMPETGGGGTKLYTMVGILLICSALYLLYKLKQQTQLKQEKRKCKWRWNI